MALEPRLTRGVLRKERTCRVDPATLPDPNAKRLDYIFFSSGRFHSAETGQETAEWELKEANVGMTMRHPTLTLLAQ